MHDEQPPADVGLSVTDVEDLDRLLAIGKYEDRYVIPQAHTELASHLMEQQGACSLDFDGGPGNCGTISDPTKASESSMLVRATQHSGLRDAAQLADRSSWIVALSRNEAAAARSRTQGAPEDAPVTAPPLVAQAAQGPAPCPRLYRPKRYYVGRRLDETEIYTVSRTELEPLAHLHHQSDAAFEWGILDSGLAGTRGRNACSHYREPADRPRLPDVLRRGGGVPGSRRVRAQPGHRCLADYSLLRRRDLPPRAWP